jgi:hypothetical protein
MPGTYTVSIASYEDGFLKELAGPQSFTCKLLDNSSTPVDMKSNVAFWKKVTEIRKASSAVSSIHGDMLSKITTIDESVLDMPAPAQNVLQKSAELRKKLQAIGIRLNGDGSRARREFETAPSVNDRIGTIEYAVWSTTSRIPKTYLDAYDVAANEFALILDELKLAEKDLDSLEKEVEQNNAPYTPGRWPVWSK